MKKSFYRITLFFIIVFFLIINKSCASDLLNSEYVTGTVESNTLNLRSGTSTDYPIISKLSKNEKIKIYGLIDDWYIIQTDSNLIGVVNKDFIKIDDDYQNSNSLSQDESEVFKLINTQRIQNGLQPLKIDENIQNLARLKAKDLVDNNCFSHISPSYGTPFDMLRNNSINYKVASENIAGNANIKKAVDSWLNSETHKKNILSNTYNYTGIGVVNSITYGKIIVELFIGK